MSFIEFLITFGPRLLAGLQTTVILCFFASVFVTVIALVLAIMRLSGKNWINAAAVIYIEFFRGSSLLVQIYWLYFVLPLFGLTLKPFTAGVLAVGLNLGAYGAEIVRSAVLAVPKNQWEAAKALNLNRFHTVRRIIAPQALYILLPGWGNILVDVVKASALVSLISVVDLMYVARQINGQTFMSAEVFGAALIGYYVIVRLIIVPGMHRLERISAGRLGLPHV